MITYKIDYTLDPRNVLRFKSDNGKELPEALFSELQSRIHFERLIKLDKSFNVLSIAICSSREVTFSEMVEINSAISENIATGKIDMNLQEISVKDLLANGSINESDKQYLHSVCGADVSIVETEVAPSKDEEKPAEEEAPQTEDPEEDVFETVGNLIAVEELKSWAKEMKGLMDKNISPRLLQQSLMSMSYLVSVNAGNGCTTVFETIGKILSRVLGKKEAVVREFVIEPDKESKNYNINKIVNDLSYIDENQKLYVFALWIDKLQNNKYMASYIELLTALRDQSKKAVFIFALPYLEKVAISEMHDRIEDIIPNRVISVKPMSNEDYIHFFERYFKKFDMTISGEAYSLLLKKVAEERSDGRFYGIDTVNKICDEILYHKLKCISDAQDETMKFVLAEDVSVLLRNEEHSDEDTMTGMQKLDSLISLENVKKRIKEIVATVEMQRKMDMHTKNAMHMMFSGAPGTGKTMVARILGEILREEKILSVGGFYEVSRKDLVGSYVGHTAPKTAEVCKLAYGSVLFIDEAYTLDGGSENDYGKEAIGTLIAEMENKRDDLVVIFAGYDKELERLFDLNPGLRDRIPYRISFSNYNQEELKQIFYKMLPKEFACAEEFNRVVEEFFDGLSSELMQNENFSNARFVRNLVERVMSKAALRMQMDGQNSSELIFTESDFNLAISDSEFNKLNEKKKTTKIGFLV
ncbi:MAG: AAA family ATPase [Ruminococcaceae bacterium]|nr:AAA family ATPase [Oscillospiraceae bacterium]